MGKQDNQPPSLFDNLEMFGSKTVENKGLTGTGPMRDLYDFNFRQYSAYVICSRAIPAVEDGLKPVQRRIMHALFEQDDGRYTKVANIVGQTMQYHPHGDASIGDAIVVLANKLWGKGNGYLIWTGKLRFVAHWYAACGG